MKVNPVAIQSYQQAVRREDSAALKPGDKNEAADSGKNVKIAPQNEGVESRVAVKARVGNYADILTPEEKNALDLLFSRFRDADRFGPGYRQSASTGEDENLLGGMIDVKV